MNNIDKLEFKLIDAKKSNEPWAEDCETPIFVVEIYINGKEVVPILKEIEQPYCDAEGTPEIAGGYGHNLPEDLYKALSEAIIEGTYSNKYGVELLCCRDCGFSGCWSAITHIRQTEDYIYWESFENNHRKNWKYNLSYKFDKAEYDKAMKQLKSYISN